MAKLISRCGKFLAILPAIQKIASDCGCDVVVHLDRDQPCRNTDTQIRTRSLGMTALWTYSNRGLSTCRHTIYTDEPLLVADLLLPMVFDIDRFQP